MKDVRSGAKPFHSTKSGPRPGVGSHHRPVEQKKPPTAGEGARDAAVYAVAAVLQFSRAFDDALSEAAGKFVLEPRDRAFARAIASAVLRNRGSLSAVIGKFLEKPLPKDIGKLEIILLAAAAQLLILKTPPHAAISLAVDQCRADRKAKRFDRLANAVLRRVSEKGGDILSSLDSEVLNIPAWMFERWRSVYGEDLARRIARASLQEAALDLSVKQDAELWAEKLGGTLLAAGSVRLSPGGRVEDLAGFADGAWWVQDAAAALPAKILGDVRGLDVADLCAAPGGKTAQLAVAGARVVAVDQSAERMARLKSNLERLKLTAETVIADIGSWQPGKLFDAILIDAPCTATGTIRRHPDILYLKRKDDIAALARIQAGILEGAARLLKPGGRMVFCTCSLEPEEGPDQIDAFLARHPEFSRMPIDPALIGGMTNLVTERGELRTLPSQLDDSAPGLQGLDGFFAACLVRKA